MSKKAPQVYQFKITLEGIRPAIWRRIQVLDTYTFRDLDYAIQRAMGWEGYHLHQFMIKNPRTGEADTIGSDDDSIPEGKKSIASYFSLENKKAHYEYDFGDGWKHKILLEKILPLEEGKKYPICLAGERACPPEDCGGVWGYEDLLDIIKNPKHKEYEERMEWLGDKFDPEYFKPEDADFDH